MSTTQPANAIAALKHAAAARALDYVKDGMTLGLGSGSTAEVFLDLLAARVRAGLKIVGTPTSERTSDKAEALGIPLKDLDSLAPLDLVVDGALLREKIVAASAKRMVVIADDSKLVTQLGTYPLPVEVVAFGHVTTASRIEATAAALGYTMTPVLRIRDRRRYRTDNKNCIYDCAFGAIADVAGLAAALSSIPGVVEHGLFVGLASVLVIAGIGGVRVIEHDAR